ncbi:MAG: DEAD/DEAH box helicase [Desulfovibrionaceae bacterium]|nr:DEAD/DEAH box helicase [Desulfovibrionaceae bacterium]
MSESFSNLALCHELLRAVEDLGFKEPTPIQGLAVPRILAGVDLAAQAAAGSGKTAAFGLPLLEKIKDAPVLPCGRIQALVLCPTRELCVQVAEDLRALASRLDGVGILPVYGGQPLERQTRVLARGSLVVVGTPGRVLDHLERRTLSLEKLSLLVLDEADEMLDLGFREDLARVLRAAPQDCQKLCFSATFPPSILRLIRAHLREAELIRANPEEFSGAGTEQYYYDTRRSRKFEDLCLILDSRALRRGIIFCATRRGADELAALLQARGFRAEALHGDLLQARRDRVMRGFRKGNAGFLVATDLAARGLDLDRVEAVINYDLPAEAETYIHRIGRTGRAGRPGLALSLVTPREMPALRSFARLYGAGISKGRLPKRREVEESRFSRVLDEIRVRLEAEQAAEKNSARLHPHVLRLSALLEGREDKNEPLILAAVLFGMLLEAREDS